DGFGFGGWPLDADNHLLVGILGYTRELIPAQYPMHALGVGHPENVLACYRLGYGIFDSAMPTRDARHGRLYSFDSAEGPLNGNWLRYVYIGDEKHIRANIPVSPGCDCLTCSRYSIAYLRHLFKMNDSLYPRLATIHNLRFMTQLTERMKTPTHGR
ncbi:tRNA-guanine transglycosylase, partial [bacterium]|nr:tRNA-guanine transglycosylase [bacterium]